MSVPRRSREVHAFDAVRADALALLKSDPAAYFAATHKPAPFGYRSADCVCEEPCRYCRCER